MKLFVFARCVCFCKSRVTAVTGVLKKHSYPSGDELRDLCEVEFWEVCFLGKVQRMFTVFRMPRLITEWLISREFVLVFRIVKEPTLH